MAQKDGEKLIKKHPQIDLLIGTAHVNSFKEILTDFLADKGGRIYDDMAISGSEFEGNRVRQSGFFGVDTNYVRLQQFLHLLHSALCARGASAAAALKHCGRS